MGSALTSGVTGLQAHQRMLEVAGNNLANVNSYAFKGSSVGFSELLSETLRNASGSTENMGGINPQQVGSGVGIANITKNMAQGGFESTGGKLDMAIEGEGYFVLNSGGGNLYSRFGAFTVSDGILVDTEGRRVQRIGSAGEAEGFQAIGDSSITVPSSAIMPANATSVVNISGNLRSDGSDSTTSTLFSDLTYTLTSDGSKADGTTALSALAQLSGTFDANDTVTIQGTLHDGTTFDYTSAVLGAGATLDDIEAAMNHASALNSASSDGATASITNEGKIKVIDNTTGYSLLDITSITYNGVNADPASLEEPAYFEMPEVGGNDSCTTTFSIYDSMGGQHALTGVFVKTDTANTWDFVLSKLTGNIAGLTDRRITGLTFKADGGAFMGVTDASSDLSFKFDHDPLTVQSMTASLGTIGFSDGVSQMAVPSTAGGVWQDGYKAGTLTAISADNGSIIASFSNGVKKVIATVQVALFQNPGGLESIGGGYFTESANSGVPTANESSTGGAGNVRGQQLEKSNVEVAEEFVTMIRAQNGFQANARTIRVANEILQELTNLIR